MSSFVERTLVPAVLLLGLVGCYDAHLCDPEERCNGRDDNCNGIIDEGFRDEDGAYRRIDHCGGCGLDCRLAYPTAEEVACEDDPELGPICVLVRCPEGFRRAGDGACVPEVPVLCLPCVEDVDCERRLPGARCLETGSGQGRCGQPCGGAMPGCPTAFACEEGQCAPTSGLCGCDGETEAELACILRVEEDGHACVGIQRCSADGLGECEPALAEACNGQDDNCNGEIDEDFRDDEGRYVDRAHCGACATPCVEPGPNMVAECVAEGDEVRCEVECLEGFVDVDGILANGCECERFEGGGPPPVIGGDSNCDGIPDDDTDYIFVTTTGSDGSPGTLVQPMRTIGPALARGAAEGKDVLVARGVYQGPIELVSGVSLFGGYAPDFRDRDLELYPVVIERRTGAPGEPALICRDLRAVTRIEGFTVLGSDAAAAGEGSTAIYLDGCGPEVTFRNLTVFAGRGADGARGADSTERLAAAGYGSLADLVGRSGGNGNTGTGGGTCVRIPAGAGGAHSCAGADVGGGVGGAGDCPDTGCTNGSPCANAGCTDFTVGGVCDVERVFALAVPNPAASPGRGLAPGPARASTSAAPTNRGICNFCDDSPPLPRTAPDGRDGGFGADGAGGSGCAVAPGFDASAGRLSGASGTAGGAGVNGSGGGGAPAGGGYAVIGGTSGTCESRSGGSGGGGGSGGCGAPPASGGTGGGASAGVVIRLPAGIAEGPRFTNVRVVTASGGTGGDGGVGADGGAGGVGGIGGGAPFWCSRNGGRGGDGGRGGARGGGGGGCGGGSYGVYIQPSSASAAGYRASLVGDVLVDEIGVAGRGGRGGFSPGASGSIGADGVAESIALRE